MFGPEDVARPEEIARGAAEKYRTDVAILTAALWAPMLADPRRASSAYRG